MTSATEKESDDNTMSLAAENFNQEVRKAIEKYRQNPNKLEVFSSPQKLGFHGSIELFRILMETRLGSCDIDVASYLSAMNKSKLSNDLSNAYASESFGTLIAHPDMPTQFLEGPLGMSPSNSARP